MSKATLKNVTEVTKDGRTIKFDERRDAIYCGGSPGLRCEVKRSDYHRARAALHQEGIATGEER